MENKMAIKDFATQVLSALRNRDIEKAIKIINHPKFNLDEDQTHYILQYLASNENAASIIRALKGKIRLTKEALSHFLWLMVNHNGPDAVDALIDLGADPNALAEDKFFPLVSAIYRNNVDIVKVLLERGANPNFEDKHGYSALMSAILSENSEIIKVLIEAGADINNQSKTDKGISNKNPLAIAVQTGNIDNIRLLLESGADPNLTNGDDGSVTLHHACIYEYSNALDITKLMIEHGADINKKDSDNQDFLIYVACSKNQDIIQFAIDNGADLNTVDNFGNTPLHYLVRNSNLDENETVAIMEKMLVAGANPNIVSKHGETLLIAAIQNNIDVAKHILPYTDNINQKTEDGMSAFLFAAMMNDLDLMKELADRGANINDISNDNSSAIAILLSEEKSASQQKTFDWLFENGAELHDDALKLAVEMSIQRGYPEVAARLPVNELDGTELITKVSNINGPAFVNKLKWMQILNVVPTFAEDGKINFKSGHAHLGNMVAQNTEWQEKFENMSEGGREVILAAIENVMANYLPKNKIKE